MTRTRTLLALFAGLLLAGGSHAQLLPGAPPLQLPQVTAPLAGTLDDARGDVRRLPAARALDVAALLRAHRRELDTDAHGAVVVRGEIVAIDPTPEAMQALRQAGFTLGAQRVLDPLALRVVSLGAPPGRDTRAALALAASVDPAGSYDFDHLYWRSASVAPTTATAMPTVATPAPVRVGLVDSGVDDRHPALTGTDVQHWGCNGQRVPDAHGTAVASLLAGRAVAGAAAGSTLFAADVYCGKATGGTAMAVAQALAWLSREQVGVVNISLVGPPNRLLDRAVAAMQARGHLLVAAVGNDGPAAAPLYPAAYAGVVGVGAVNARERVLPEAGRGPQVDFVAPGAGLVAAAPGGRWHAVRGTSFAAPLVARLAALHMSAPGTAGAAAALSALERDAVLPPGADVLAYGHGVVGLRLPLTRAPGT
jgi:hypothetical protein